MPRTREVRCRRRFIRRIFARSSGLLTRLGLAVCSITAIAVTGCDNPNIGVPPPREGFFFPSGLLLDPRTPEGEPARYLFVSNGNNDLRYNSGTIAVVDLERFFAAWSDEDGKVFPYCERDADGEVITGSGRCVLAPASITNEQFPCRRLSLLPQVVECDESPFVVESVRIGNFGTVMASSHEPSGRHRLWIPVRGEPSVTYLDIEGVPGEPPHLYCGQDERADGDDRCSDAYRLTRLRNDGDLSALPREPFNILVHETEAFRHAYVAHAAGGALTLIDLDGIQGKPAIVDVSTLFAFSNGIRGGFGLAARPCSVEADNVPSATRGCQRPLVYGGFRFEPFVTTFTTSTIDPAELDTIPGRRDGCYVETPEGSVYAGPYCAAPEDIGQPCAITCEANINLDARFFAGGLARTPDFTVPILGDIAFGDEAGDVLYALQTNPGALLRIDTSLDSALEPVNAPAAPPIEICEQPNRMKLWNGHAYITCFQSAFIYVVDLRAARVVDAIVAGTGPHDLVVDPVREVLYAVNTLENSISVVDLGRSSPNRHREIARIGLQEPFAP